MNRMAYSFLNSARVLHFEWLRLKAKRDELESCLLPAAIRYDKDKVQTSPNDQMSEIVSRVIELENEMQEIQYNKSMQIAKIDEAISKLESVEERTALSMRYINRVSVSDIAEAMGYSEKRIYQFMDRGGAEIAKTLEKLENTI